MARRTQVHIGKLSLLRETTLVSLLSKISDLMRVLDSEYCLHEGAFESGKGVPILISTGIEVKERGRNYAIAEHFTFFTQGEWEDNTRIESGEGPWRAASIGVDGLRKIALEEGKHKLMGYLSQYYNGLGVAWSGQLDLSEATESYRRFLASKDDTSQKLRWVADSTQSKQLTLYLGELLEDQLLSSLNVEENPETG